MPSVICTLPKELIIGKSGLRREAKYGTKAGDVTIKWEDHERGLVAKNVPDDVAKQFLKVAGYSIENDAAKTSAPPVETASIKTSANIAPPPKTSYPSSAPDVIEEKPMPQGGGRKPKK